MLTKLIGRWLNEGELQPHPHEVFERGLHGVETALRALRDEKASGVTYVVRIADTSGVGIEKLYFPSITAHHYV